MTTPTQQAVSLRAPSDEWTQQQQLLFQRIRREMKSHPEAFQHPWAHPISERDWHVLCWTVAWFAAGCIDKDSSGETQPAALGTEVVAT